MGQTPPKKVCVPKIDLQHRALLIGFIFLLRKKFLMWVGGWVGGWVVSQNPGGGIYRGIYPPPFITKQWSPSSGHSAVHTCTVQNTDAHEYGRSIEWCASTHGLRRVWYRAPARHCVTFVGHPVPVRLLARLCLPVLVWSILCAGVSFALGNTLHGMFSLTRTPHVQHHLADDLRASGPALVRCGNCSQGCVHRVSILRMYVPVGLTRRMHVHLRCASPCMPV